jgi:PAS domain-containing protein
LILRVLRARVIAGQEARLRHFVRDEAIAQALRVPGLVSFQPATRETRSGLELVIVSTWTGFDDLTAVGQRLDSPIAMPGVADLVEEGRAEHYELVIGEARAMPLREAKLRLTRIPIRRHAESAYYAAVRQWSDRLLDETGMVAFSLGRRVVGQQDEIVAAQVWQDEAALREAAGVDVDRPMGETELSAFWAATPAIEHFDALTAIEPRPNAPAILVADDDRRYVHATPAAAQLSGRSVARLLTMRVEDVTRAAEREAVPEAWQRFVAQGSMHGPYTLERPDGSEVEVTFASKANTPWPGSHASLLVPVSEEGTAGEAADAADPERELDRALVDAGLVARYAPSSG